MFLGPQSSYRLDKYPIDIGKLVFFEFILNIKIDYFGKECNSFLDLHIQQGVFHNYDPGN